MSYRKLLCSKSCRSELWNELFILYSN